MSGFSKKPKILRGAFVEYGLSIPPLFVVFQFNPDMLSRNRSISIEPPTNTTPGSSWNKGTGTQSGENSSSLGKNTLRDFHKRESLSNIQKGQKVSVSEEDISFKIRLDATYDLDEGNPVAQTVGISPQLATLEMMVHPKDESLLGAALGALLGGSGGFSFTKRENPPMILFIWGYTRVLPVNITSMNIEETEFNSLLFPTRATVSVSLKVIEGKNIPYKSSKALKEAMSVLNLANIGKMVNVVVPG